MEREPATPAERNFRDLWEASCAVLKRYGFVLDRQDRREGVITTYAVSGGHGLEALWRNDASNFFYFQENTAQNILRAARVTIRRLPDRPEEFDFRVEVRMARTTRPPPPLTDAVEVNRMRTPTLPDLRFGDLEDRPLRRGEVPRGARAYLVPLGNDEDLAQRIDRSIRARAGIPDYSFSESPVEVRGEPETGEPLPAVSGGSPRRTVILAGPLEEPRTAPASAPTESATAEYNETAPGAARGEEKNFLLASLRPAASPTAEPTVRLIFRLRNVGDKPLRLPEPKHGVTLFGRFRRAGETKWQGTAAGEEFALPRVIVLPPGQTLDVPVETTLPAAGDYEIFFRYTARPLRGADWSGDLDSNILPLHRSPAR